MRCNSGTVAFDMGELRIQMSLAHLSGRPGGAGLSELTGRTMSLQSLEYLAYVFSAAQSSNPGVSCSPHMLILRPGPLGLMGVPLPETSLQSVASGLQSA